VVVKQYQKFERLTSVHGNCEVGVLLMHDSCMQHQVIWGAS
jgi:hypothetical protein